MKLVFNIPNISIGVLGSIWEKEVDVAYVYITINYRSVSLAFSGNTFSSKLIPDCHIMHWLVKMNWETLDTIKIKLLECYLIQYWNYNLFGHNHNIFTE